MILGITVSEAWQQERESIMYPGDQVQISGRTFTFIDARNTQGANFSSVVGTFAVSRDGAPLTVMQPEKRQYTHPPMETTEAAIYATFAGDLYAVIGEADGQGGYAVRLYVKPMVGWIWLGALVMALGGAMSLSDRRLRLGVPARRRVRMAAAE